MNATVRIAITEEGTPLTWPRRCAACGAKEGLVASTSRVGRVKSVRPNLVGGFTMKSDVLHVSTPMCARHAGANAMANRILEHSPLMGALRGFSVLLALMALPLVIGVLRRGPGALRDVGGMAVLALLGLFGSAAIVWARKNWQVRPVRLDPDMDVVEVEFRNEVYAAEFKRANREATSGAATDPLPWYRRSGTWKAVVMALFVFFMWRLMRQA